MSTEEGTAIVAVVIAVIAFFVTTAQLLQALFGTAEGYRRCQSSVIGQWASKTRRKFRWSEFRFETIFSTPDIRLQRGREEDKSATSITGDFESRKKTLISHVESSDDRRGDLVSWLMLLHRLHVLQDSQFSSFGDKSARRSLKEKYPSLRSPRDPRQETTSYAAVRVRTRSWDFMPPDIVRPFASSTMGDIIAIAHRLGMEWKDLRPGENIMRAEGNGQSISSTPIRSLGILLQYTNDRFLVEDKVYMDTSLTVCSAEADKFGFGIIPGFGALGMSDIPLNDAPEMTAVKNAMRALGIEDYVKNFGDQRNLRSFFDLIPLVAPWIPLQGSKIVQIRRPCRDLPGPTVWWEGFITFHHRLRDIYENKSDTLSSQMRWVLEKFEMLRAKYPWNKAPSWEGESVHNTVKNGRDLDFLDDVFNLWQECTEYLQDILQKHEKTSIYGDLVAGHIAQAVTCPVKAETTVGNGVDKNARWYNGPVRSHHMAETMHLYIDNIPKVVDFMERRGFNDGDVVKDAWWTMILRAFCWQRSVAFVDRDSSSVAIPSGLYYSKVPVYIA